MLPTQSTLSLARDTQPQGHWESRNCLHFASTQLSLLPPKPIWPWIFLAPFLSVASLFLLLYSVCFSGEHLLFPVEPQERKAEESRVATVRLPHHGWCGAMVEIRDIGVSRGWGPSAHCCTMRPGFLEVKPEPSLQGWRRAKGSRPGRCLQGGVSASGVGGWSLACVGEGPDLASRAGTSETRQRTKGQEDDSRLFLYLPGASVQLRHSWVP